MGLRSAYMLELMASMKVPPKRKGKRNAAKAKKRVRKPQ